MPWGIGTTFWLVAIGNLQIMLFDRAVKKLDWFHLGKLSSSLTVVAVVAICFPDNQTDDSP